MKARKIKVYLAAITLFMGIFPSAQARYYDPIQGRFLSPDSVVPNPKDPQSFNRYAYARNNPIVYTDPNGHGFWVPIIVGAVIGATSVGAQTDWNAKAMLKGAVIGGVSGGAGAGLGSYLMSNTGSVVLSSIAGGAAGGGVGGLMSTAMFGGSVSHAMDAMARGAMWGGIAGGLAQKLTMIGMPDALAQAGSSYLSGYWQAGANGAKSGATYGFAGSILSAALIMSGLDADGNVPFQNSTEEISQWSTNQSMVVTPEIQAKDWFWIFLGLLSGGYDHTRHTKDTLNSAAPEKLSHKRYYRVIQNNVPHPGEAYISSYDLPDGSHVLPYRLFSNNCTTRFGYLSPSAYRANFQNVGKSIYWYE